MKTTGGRIYLRDLFVGEVDAGQGIIQLTYSDSWKQSGFAISHSLPLKGDFSKNESHNYLSNLLPEGSLRDLICQKLGISPDNDWELLLRIGKESAGALTILPFGEEIKTSFDYEPLSADRLEKLSRTQSVMPEVLDEENLRLSLAGAQDKIAALFKDGAFLLPLEGAPTNTILKFENSNYKQITANEVFVTHLAKAAGLPTCEARLIVFENSAVAAFERYDRVDKGQSLFRIHQEDTCQALGRSQKIKYQKEGGPSFSEVLELITEICDSPIQDRQQLIRWQVFNILCGNSDGHGKNISFLRDADQIRLTPFYDLVCTRIYRNLDRRLAMGFSGEHDPDLLDKARLKSWAKEIGVTEKYLRSQFEELIQSLGKVLPDVEEQFQKSYGSFGLIEQIRLFVKKQIKSVTKRLEL